MGAEGAEQVPDVVADRLGAQMELVGYLARRPAALEQLQHLVLPRREVELRMGVRLLDEIRDLAEDADDVLPVVTRTEPTTFLANRSRARRVSSGATMLVKCRPRASPTRRRPAAFNHRTTPLASRT